MNNTLGRTSLIRKRSAGGSALGHDAAPASASASPTAATISLFPAIDEEMLYPLPSIQPTNKLYLRRAGNIEGSWAIDSGMKIPKDALNLTNYNELDTRARANVDLESKNGGIVTKLYIVPSASPLSFMGFKTRAATIRIVSNWGGHIKVALLNAQKEAQGAARKSRTSCPPLHIYCKTGAVGDVSIALPRSFRGSILLGRRAKYISDGDRPSICEYSAAVKERLSVITANDDEHRGFIGFLGKGAKDRLEVDCHGRIYICYEYEEVGVPDTEATQCTHQ